MLNFNPTTALAGVSTFDVMSPKGGANLPGLNNLAKLFSGLGTALQALADMLADGKSPVGVNPFVGGTPSHGTHHTGSAGQGVLHAPVEEKPIAGKARIWGDPHFIGADGDQFDVQGQAGKIYNLLSDQNFQLNGKFEAYGSGGATVVGEAAINADGNFITVDKKGDAFVNGQKLKDGQKVDLFGGGTAEKKGDHLIVTKGEWKVDFEANGQYLNMDIETKNAIADGVKPQGLIGQTFDGDGKALMGDAGEGAQGGGAIKDANGNLTKAGDKDAVKSYEVDSLFSSIFKNHNASGFAHFVSNDGTLGGGRSDHALQDLNQQLGRLAMLGFFTLMSSLSATSIKPWGSAA